ncbi:hypothetical protein ACVDIR_001036 [Listeria monocytogenes]|uniref:hypothetical protein n=1 Tax=Listeria monocytogenes TaxID=1639 RepID=UPI0024755E37
MFKSKVYQWYYLLAVVFITVATMIGWFSMAAMNNFMLLIIAIVLIIKGDWE